MHIGIIGFGNFGQFLAKRFLKSGHQVSATNRSDYSKVALEMGATFYENTEDLCKQNIDCLILATSILSLESVVKALPLYLLKEKLIIDVLSVKSYPKEFLKRILPNECDILCTHPMFGPESGKNSWKHLSFVFEKVRIRNEKICEEFLGVFEKEGCTMIPMSCEKHDEYAAGSQFITHTTGRMLSQLHLKSTPINTKGYEKLLELVENTVNDSFDLYYGLFRFNENARSELLRMEQALTTLKHDLFDRMKEERRTTLLGIQGGNGSFNHQAALEIIEKYNLKSVELVFLITSEAVLEALNRGEIDFGVFAIENSGSGTVLPSIHSMSKYPHEIIELHDMKLTQCLLVRPGEDITKATKIITHPQAIKQCRKTLAEKYPYLKSDYLSDDYDTAMCARELAEGAFEEGTAVIASEIAAQKYGLEIAFKGLNDDPENYTSFVFCKRRER